MKPVLCVVGARPNYMKMAPILRALAARKVPATLVHTGQHYDESLSDRFFDELGMPRPAVNLEVGSASHAQQTAEVMKRFEPVLIEHKPSVVVVVGDVNSTIACALVAVKLGIPVAHVEAGLRSYDRAMPEEINRVLTDQISELLFTTERSAAANLAKEGIDPARVHFVGNVMIDTLQASLPRAVPPPAELKRKPGYAVLTLHRPSNVDNPATLERLFAALGKVSEKLPIVFPVHPRTAQRLDACAAAARLGTDRLLRRPPLGYLEMLGLMRDAQIVLTDSGGMQEETTALGVPCITLRENTERPITVEEGTNTVAGTDPTRILAAVDETLASGGKRGRYPELWDGRAAERIAEIVTRRFPEL
jgi:UDP-N-acetylglucosamine 2-epimerase (non-hydrolysing)